MLISGLLQHGSQGLGVEGNHADGVPILCQQLLHHAGLVGALGAAAAVDVVGAVIGIGVLTPSSMRWNQPMLVILGTTAIL